MTKNVDNKKNIFVYSRASLERRKEHLFTISSARLIRKTPYEIDLKSVVPRNAESSRKFPPALPDAVRHSSLVSLFLTSTPTTIVLLELQLRGREEEISAIYSINKLCNNELFNRIYSFVLLAPLC